MNDLRILVTGCGAIVAPSIIKNYKEVKERSIYVVGVDIKKNVSNKYIDKFYQCKKASDEEYIPTLIKICKKENYVVLLPADEDSTEVLILKEGKQIVDGTEDVEYTTIDDENETKEVFEIFKDKFKDEFDFEDDEDEEDETEE